MSLFYAKFGPFPILLNFDFEKKLACYYTALKTGMGNSLTT